MPTATEQPAKLARLTIVDVTADDDDRGEPMTAAIALVATPQVTLGSVIELLAYLEGVALRRLAEVMPFVRAHDMTYVGIAGVLRDWMRCALARIVAAPTDGAVERVLKGEETGPQPGCDGVTDAAL